MSDVKELVSNILEHHGVKGMKWGVRRRSKAEEKARAQQFGNKNKPTTPGGNGKPASSPKVADKVGVRDNSGKFYGSKTATDNNTKLNMKKPASQLSDKQLKEAIDRMDLEKRYSDLNSQLSAKNQTKGQKILKDLGDRSTKVILDSAQGVAQKQLTNVGNRLVGDALQKKFGIKPPKEK